MTIALVMAGGRSVRMRRSGGPQHKALQPLLGRPLIEHNLRQLIDAGFEEIVVAVNCAEEELLDYVESQRQEFARENSVSLECLVEHAPLGTIGAAGQLADRDSDVLTVFVDNISLLDYRQLVAHHQRRKAAMTMAVHVHRFGIPFGQVVVRDGAVDEYLEKPRLPVLISSGTYVLSSSACRMLAGGGRCDAPQLFARVKDAGQTIAAWQHQAAWIDINDTDALNAAEQLVQDNLAGFDTAIGADRCTLASSYPDLTHALGRDGENR
jgi:NDP-sugar pyrophosphorylase family protein